MSESEFDIIKTYFSNIGKAQDWLVTGVGDDAAILNPNPNEHLLVAIDTLNEGVHFLADTSPADIGYKALAVNISDIAAMGGQPLWFTMSLSLPLNIEARWLESFSSGLKELASEYGLNLIGGDTTRGALSVTIQIGGAVPQGEALSRTGAQPGDDIFVTGTMGDAAAGLMVLQENRDHYSSDEKLLFERLHRPTPRVDIGLALRRLATACIDISDGLTADLGHILETGRFGAEIDKELIPLSEPLQQCGLGLETQYKLAMHGGDDYELCFTTPETERSRVDAISEETGCPITRIGKIIDQQGLFMVSDGQQTTLAKKGFDHFLSS
ncbi:MAG: thiamine-phosphate kinase [Thioalkalispiraceae bacterium]|jgi:thiamine-monophosphate kinase